MKMKIWSEITIYTDNDQKVTLQPTEDMADNKVVIQIDEMTAKDSFRVYLTFDEAKELSKRIINYIENM